MAAIGVMEMPPDFKYLDVYQKGKPTHDRYDRFSIRHPRMDPGKRAKIFAPFDALRGFSEAISATCSASEAAAHEAETEDAWEGDWDAFAAQA